MIRSPTSSPAVQTKTPPPSSVPPEAKRSPPGPRSPARRWLRNHAFPPPPLNPSRLRLFHRRQVDGALRASPAGTEPVEAKGWASGELARRAKRDQAVEQPPPGAIAETRDRRRGGNRVVGEQRRDGARLPLGAQFWAHVREPGRPARQVLGQVEGSERRASISERDQFPPAGLARPRPPSLAGGAAHKKLAGEERQRRWPAEGFGQRGVGAKKRKRLGVGLERNDRFSSRSGGDWGGP